MKSKIACALLLACSTTLFAGQDDWSYNNHWSIYGDYLRLKRFGIRDILIAQKTSGGRHIGPKRATSNFSFEPAYRLGLFFNWNEKNSFEGSFLHVEEWIGTSSMKGSDAPIDVLFTLLSSLSDYNNGDYFHEKYQSKYDTAEVNWWYNVTPRRDNYFAFSSIVGLRHLRVDEGYEFSMTKGENKSSYHVSSQNHLYGGQVGGNIQWNPLDNLSWEVMAKVGLFYNDLSQKSLAGDLNNTITLANYKRDGSVASFLGEAFVLGRYYIGRFVSIQLGYQFTYLDSLTLAPEQVSLKTNSLFNNRLTAANQGVAVSKSTILGKRLRRTGYIKVQGGFVGLTVSF